MAGTIQVTLVPTAFTQLGSGPMLISNAVPIGIAASGTGTPLPNAAVTVISGGERPFSVPQAEVFYGILLVPGFPAAAAGATINTSNPSTTVGITT